VRDLGLRLRNPPDVEVEVACLSKWGPVADQLRDAGVRVTAFDARGARDLLRVVRELIRLTKDQQIDTVFSFLIHANTVAAIASRKLRELTVIESIQTVQRRPKWHWWLQRRIHGRAKCVVVPSSAVARRARTDCGIPSDKVVVIPNGLEPSQFPRVEVFRDKAVLRVGFLGRLDRVKGLEFFVQSVAFSAFDGLRIEGHIFGEGPERPRVEKAIRDFKAQDRVFLRGAVQAPQVALREMDVLFFTGGQEGFGLVVIEAMASGVPVIAFASGGVTDILRDGENGILLGDDMFSYRFLNAKLHYLLTHPQDRDRMIERGLRTVADKYSWDIIIPKYRTLLGIAT